MVALILSLALFETLFNESRICSFLFLFETTGVSHLSLFHEFDLFVFLFQFFLQLIFTFTEICHERGHVFFLFDSWVVNVIIRGLTGWRENMILELGVLMLRMKIFQFFISDIQLFHYSFSHQESLFQLFAVESFKICHSEALISLLKEWLLSAWGHCGLTETKRCLVLIHTLTPVLLTVAGSVTWHSGAEIRSLGRGHLLSLTSWPCCTFDGFSFQIIQV